MKILKEQLPKTLQKSLKKSGHEGDYIEGYFMLTKEQPNGFFMGDNVIGLGEVAEPKS